MKPLPIQVTIICILAPILYIAYKDFKANRKK